MDSVVRRYIVRILLLHVAFLIAAAAVIASAGLTLYASARADAESAALERVAVPANQTKDLLERHFQGIFDTLRLAARTPAPDEDPPQSVLRAQVTGRELWFQLRGRISVLLEVEPADLSLVEFRANPKLGPPDGEVGQWRELREEELSDPTLLLVPPSLRSSPPDRALAERLIRDAAPWLGQVMLARDPAVSGVMWLYGTGEGGKSSRVPVVLAAVPLFAAANNSSAPTNGTSPATTTGAAPPQIRTLLVGVVPVAYLEENFLSPAGQAERNGMLLFDSNGRLVAGGGETYAGKHVQELARKQIPESLATFISNTLTGGTTDARQGFEGRVDLGTIQFDSSLATARPVRAGDRLPGLTAAAADMSQGQRDTRKGIIEGQPGSGDSAPEVRELFEAQGRDSTAARKAPMWLFALVNRQAVVAPLAQTTRTAVLWAGAMVVAVTVILLSSAVQLIRSRSRLERLRTEMIDRELREARQIQLMWLPADTIQQTATRQIEIAAENIPASHISGDFYNYFDLADGRTALVIGDVTGHGLVAAFLMATTQLLVRTTLQRLSDPGKTLEDVNNQLCSQAYHGQFVTIQLVVIDPKARQIEAASAGHPPPLTCGADGRWRALPLEPQLVLGVLEGSLYPTQTIPMDGCQTLLMYTDGVIEAKNRQEQRFSLDLLLEQMNQRIGADVESAKQLVEKTFEIVRQFAGETPQDDDLTLLALHLAPRAAQQDNAPEPQGSATSSRKSASRKDAGTPSTRAQIARHS